MKRINKKDFAAGEDPISIMESDRQQIGRDRAIKLAKALKVHPAVIMFPNYRVLDKAA